MTKKQDLMNLARDMRVLESAEKKHYLLDLDYCQKLSCYKPDACDALRNERHYRTFKEILVFDLTRTLAGNPSFGPHNLSKSAKEDRIQYLRIQKGVEAFVSANQEERNVFCKKVQEKATRHQIRKLPPLGLPPYRWYQCERG